MNKVSNDKVCVCGYCGHPMRNPDAVNLGRKYFSKEEGR